MNKMSETNKANEIKWRNVFDNKKWYGIINKCAYAANNAGYKMFLWNDRIYEICGCLDIEEVDCRDTGKTIADLETK